LPSPSLHPRLGGERVKGDAKGVIGDDSSGERNEREAEKRYCK